MAKLIRGSLIPKDTMESLRDELKKRAAMPPPKADKYTRTQLALELENEIKQMLNAGYTYAQVAAIFKEKGVEIGEATLKTRKRAQQPDNKNGGIEGAKERIVAKEAATKTAAQSGRFAVRPDSTDL